MKRTREQKTELPRSEARNSNQLREERKSEKPGGTGRLDTGMRSALRTLTVLRALNVRNGATVCELATATGISRPALYRILETLRDAGYVAVDLHGGHYCLTMLVRSLAEGFNEEDWVTQVARPELRRLQKKVVWPVDLGTFMDDSVWIRETTRQSSPLTLDRGTTGMCFPMLSSATGRAYLAFCPEQERLLIMRNLRRSPGPNQGVLPDDAAVYSTLLRTRAYGYGERYGEPPLESGAVAVPICDETHLFGCINLTFSAKTMTPGEAATLYLRDMQEAAGRIARAAAELEGVHPEAQPDAAT